MQGLIGDSWQAANLSFWLLTVMVLGSAVWAACAPSIVQAAFSLFFTLLGMAGYYVLLGSGFLAITQVIIYVGGILVLLMFGILLTDRSLEKLPSGAKRRYLTAAVCAAVFLGMVLLPIALDSTWNIVAVVKEPQVAIRALGRALLGQYLIALELSGMTLLLCLIGAAYLVRRKER